MNSQAATQEGKTSFGGIITRFFTSHPKGFWFIFWGELAERSSYYGMRAILLLYMSEQLGLGDKVAQSWMHYFIAACYFLPLIGGYVADNYFGKYWTIVGFSLPYILGQVVIGFESVEYLIFALVLLAMGSGVIKPNISTLMGLTYDQQRPGQELLRSDAFSMFYFAINVGASASMLAMPELRSAYGYKIAFLFPAGLMAFAFLFFAAGKRLYAVEVISRHEKTPEERRLQWQALGRIIGVFGLIVFFWCIFDQQTSTFTLFARDHLNLYFLGHQWKADQIQSLNGILILVLLPPSALLWRLLSRYGLHLRATDKMLIGFIFTTATVAVMALAGYLAGDGRVSLAWEIVVYVLITCAEVCISPVGLELAFVASPKAMKGFMTGCFLLTVFAGNIINTQVTKLYVDLGPAQYFALLTLLLATVTIIFVFVARRFNLAAETWREQEVEASAAVKA